MSNDVMQTNPFEFLGVSVRDDAGTILQAVEDQALVHDQLACQQAGAMLTHPKRRLEAELGWFPGLTPNAARQASQIVSQEEVVQSGLSGLPRANALASIAQGKAYDDVDDLEELIFQLVCAVDEINLERLVHEINEDRSLAGIPAISNPETADEELKRRRSIWRRTLLDCLDRAPTNVMAEAMCKVMTKAVSAQNPPVLLHEVVDDYGLRARPFMESEITKAERLAEKARELAPERSDALLPLLDAFEELLETWQQLTYPMHASLSARGQAYEESERLAGIVRSLAIELHNKHALTADARRLSETLRSAFAASPTVAAQLEEDTRTLAQFEGQSRERSDRLTYSARVGTFGKNTLAISSDELEWKSARYPVSTITSARWGALRKSVNGVPTGTEYTIAWSDGHRSAIINFGSASIYEAFVPRMFEVLAPQIVGWILQQLKSGQTLRFDTAVVSDETITLMRPKLFGHESREYRWGDVSIESVNGNFVISAIEDPKAKVSMDYRNVPNAHFLEMLIRNIFETGGDRLSAAFSS